MALLDTLRDRGYRIWLQEGRIWVNPSSKLTEDERFAVTVGREDLIVALEEEAGAAWEAERAELAKTLPATFEETLEAEQRIDRVFSTVEEYNAMVTVANQARSDRKAKVKRVKK